MYKQQAHAPDRHHQREQEDASATATIHPVLARIQPSRRSSDPITLFSNQESEATHPKPAGRQPILPRVGPSGLFAGQSANAVESSLLSSECDGQTTSTRTSLGSALEEVLDSVDQATEDLARVRCQQRITEWLGQQPSSTQHTDKKRRRSDEGEDRRRLRRLSARVLRDLLHLDADCYSLLVKATSWRGRQQLSVAQQAHARVMEQQLMGTWTSLTQRDTAMLQSRLQQQRSGPSSFPGEQPLSTRVPLWGIPEEQSSQEEGGPGTLQVLLRYLRSYFEEHATAASTAPSTAVPESAGSSSSLTGDNAESQQVNRASMHASTVEHSNMLHRTPRPSLSRHALMAARDGSVRGSVQSSCSSSFKTVSLQTGSCSRASHRRPFEQGSHFWEVTSYRSSIQSGGPSHAGGHWVV